MPTAPALARDTDAYETGLRLGTEGRHSDAIACFERALAVRPDDARVLFALANTARAIGHGAAAENFYRRVLALAPDRTEALVNLANLLCATGRAQEAIALLSPAIARNPAIAELWLTLGSACRGAGDTERATIFYREALRVCPDYPPALGNLADLMADDGDNTEALALYARVVKREPRNAQARLNRAILHLLAGDLARGWRDYEYRLNLAGAPIATHGLPRWKGKPVGKARRLLVTAEQGIGDQIMFASLIPELAAGAAERGGQILLEAEPRLVSLFARSFPNVRVYAARTEERGGVRTAYSDGLAGLGGADEAIPLGSLALHMRRALSDFPSPHAYLVPDARACAEWRSWFAGQAAAPFIGLCWRSGKTTGLRALQYAPLEAWGRFARAAPGPLVSLQYDAQPDEIAALERLSGRTILVPPALDQKHEIDRTCAMMSCLGAVVSAPTAVSWTAAGLGVTTLKILYNNSWTGFGTDHEPFGPACRAIMPATRGHWEDCFAQALAALKRARG